MSPHHLWHFLPWWGHAGPGIATISRCLEANEALTVTLVVHKTAESRLEPNMKTYPSEPLKRLTVVYVGEADNHGAAFPQSVEGFLEYLANLKTPPTKVILDQTIGGGLWSQVREKLPGVKIWLQWNSCPLLLYITNAPHPLGLRNMEEKAKELEGGKETAIQFVWSGNGTVTPDTGAEIAIPGLPSIFDYEKNDIGSEVDVKRITDIVFNLITFPRHADGMIMSGAYPLQGEVIEKLQELDDNVKPLGTLIGQRSWDRSGLSDGQIKEFLDRQTPLSTLFIAFGSLFGPPKEKIQVILATLLESKRPFVLCRLSLEGFEQSLIDDLKNAPQALIEEGFADQIGILNHPSVGWYFTHAGWNSTQESIVAGKPMIAWPLGWNDEEYVAPLISTRAEPLGFELMQTRSFKRPTKRGVMVVATSEAMRQEFTEVLEKAFGPEGEIIRKTVQRMGEDLRRDHDGRDWEAVKEFAQE